MTSGPVAEPAQEAPARRQNSFGMLRLVLASLVVVQHALALTDHPDQTLLGLWRPASVGDIAVGGFFGLSGYLLLSSTVRHAPRRFLRLRLHRLLPGFWATLLVVAFGFAPLVAIVTGQAYPVFGERSATTYVVLNAALVVLQHGIGTLLSGNPYPDALDGSLWSLAPELICYLILLAAAMLARRLRRNPALLVGLLAAGAVLVHLLAEPALGNGLGGTLGLLASLAAAFFTGSTLAATGALHHAQPRHAALLTAALVAVIALGLWRPLGPPLLAAVVVSTGTALDRGWTTRIDARADLSYGVYLYHFPVIQLLLAIHGAGLTVGAALGLLAPGALLITLPVAAASWFLVEAPAQRRGRSSKPAARNRPQVPEPGAPQHR